MSSGYSKGAGAWGGYSWNTTLFADPAAFLAKLRASRGPLGIRVAVNTHPDEGIDACQNNYADMGKVRECQCRLVDVSG